MRGDLTFFFFLSSALCAACAAGSTAPGAHPDGGPAPSASPDSGPVPSDPPSVAKTSIAYGADPDETLDLYTPSPAPSKPAPTAVLAHGGLWQAGDRSMLSALCSAIVERSGYAFACATIEYRKSGDLGGKCAAPGVDTYRTQVGEMAAAYASLAKDAAARGLDPHRMYIGGHSAGGHLAHVLNLRWSALGQAACAGIVDCSPPVGAIGFEGIYDVYAWDAYDQSHWGAQFACATRGAFGAPPGGASACVDPGSKEPCWDEGSPRVLAERAAKLGANPAGGSLIIHSPGDDWVDAAEAKAFGVALSKAFPGAAAVVETAGACAKGQHNDVLFEADLADCIVRFMQSGGKSI